MTQTVHSDLDALRSMISGPVFGPGEAGYDTARSLWNGDIDRHPAAIAGCLSAEDVSAALTFGRAHDLEIAVRGGGHAFSGSSCVDDGLMINLGAMNQVTVDPGAEIAKVGGGATMADMDAATQAHGMAVPGGVISHTGVGGLTLGGGMGWLTHTFGLAIDNLVAAQVVLADGSIVRASDQENADLFWALRGGGGNFGIVTEFEFRLHRLGPEIHFGLFFWDRSSGADMLRMCREFLPTLPERAGALMALGLSAPPEPFVPEQYHLMPGYALLVAGFGTADEHARMVAPIRDALTPLFEFITPMPFTALQSLLDNSAPWGIHGYEKALDIDDLSDEAIAITTDAIPKKASPLSFMPCFCLDGAFSTVGADDTAFGGARTPHYVCNIAAIAPEPELLAQDKQWARQTWADLEALSSNSGGYINFMAEPSQELIRRSYGAKYARLSALKAKYDPGNVLHRNANIEPA
ncbi:FAD-binding oxidoreductase [Nocardia cyriacigeorgica]|uniref:FAD-binding oxidoreductase n=1 Tax=Nocardia cyriacigeorgica TaxID=135487 RepID=UPI002456D47A|nr:FAD-binding oxidoreductase [Nocardia cyriacigeorgica]